jgi:U3 small nucleolar RNA-associated protein 21
MTSLQPSRITTIAHPATYLNKIIVGYANGQIELWNIQKKAIVYTFASHLLLLSSASQSFGGYVDPFGDVDEKDEKTAAAFSVTCFEQSPACDVMGVGFSTGDVLLINLKLDKVLFSFKQEGGEVTSISFRTDVGSDKFPFMVTSSMDGRLHIWNLGSSGDASDKLQRKLQSTIDTAHSAKIGKVQFLYGEPIMVSCSEDNSLKVWIFDAPDGTARLLKMREGHSGYPLKIRYFGGITNASLRDGADAMSCEILSAGSDGSLRVFNTALEAQNKELSQGAILKKLGLRRRGQRLPVTTGFDFSEARQKDWANVATIHKNHSNTYLWKFGNRTITDVVLRQSHWPQNVMKFTADRSTHSTAVVMSPCGNYCAVGSKGGTIYLYNVQSGIPRGSFPKSTTPSMKPSTLLHKQAVPGNVFYEEKNFLAEGEGSGAGSLNPIAKAEVTYTDEEKEAFKNSKEGHTQDVTGMFIEIANTVMVTCGMDGLLIFWDYGTHAILQKVPHSSPLTMIQGFQDGGFVAVASQDRVVRVYDIFTHKISRRFEGHTREISDLSFSPDGRRLLSSSLDKTVRVWDMPTGRCLSWLSFESPVLSMAMSHSGEHLSVTQSGKEGIYMYVDRSLYETVHFWKEPTVPVPVSDSLSLVERIEGTAEIEESLLDRDDDLENEEVNEEMDVVPTQAQVETGADRESKAQRGAGLITMAAVARAYWTTLFNLEAIKSRNSATAAPAAPVKAPFFLPTVVRGGSTPSFPTPVEFEQLMKKNAEMAKKNESSGSSADLKRKSETDSLGSKKQKGGERSKDDGEEDEATVLAQLASMGSAWGDGEADTDSWGAGPAAVEEATTTAVKKSDTESVAFQLDRTSTSRIINRKTALPRCKLVAFILQEYPLGAVDRVDMEDGIAMDEQEEGQEEVEGPILEYLKSLPPPAIDLEFRALCTNEEDTEGALLCCFVLCCAVLCCAVLCCAVLCCAVLCCASHYPLSYMTSLYTPPYMSLTCYTQNHLSQCYSFSVIL